MKLQDIPSVTSVLEHLDWSTIHIPRPYVVTMIRNELSKIRKEIKKGINIKSQDDIFHRIRVLIDIANKPSLKQVINATGIVLHTGLGRAPFSQSMMKNVTSGVEGYVSLELDLKTGKRGERLNHISFLLSSLTGADASLVVNNNAAAVLLAINTLANGKEVVISRGQLVEIGGSFRIPEVVAKSGAKLVEVGTTNRTHFKDYEEAISENTGAILMVHTSNYRIEGFISEVTIKTVAELARKRRIPLITDLGSGALFHLSIAGLPEEPVVSYVLKQGADLVTYSGDKLLGGPQAGLICGKRRLISALHKNPLYRALRCDKMTLLLLEQTLRTYKSIPPEQENLTYALFMTSQEELNNRGDFILSSIGENIVKQLGLRCVSSSVEAGSGSLPTEKIDSVALQFNCQQPKPTELATKFRELDIPVLGYISGNRFFLDLKAVLPSQDKVLIEAIKEVTRRIFQR